MANKKGKCWGCERDGVMVGTWKGLDLCSTCTTLASSLSRHVETTKKMYAHIHGEELAVEPGGVVQVECDHLHDVIGAVNDALGGGYSSVELAPAVRELVKRCQGAEMEAAIRKRAEELMQGEDIGGETGPCNPEECSELQEAIKALFSVQWELGRSGLATMAGQKDKSAIEAQARMVVDEVIGLRGKVEHLQRELDGALAAGTMEPEPESEAIDTDEHFICPAGYEKLSEVFVGAIRQAAYGKGMVRHATPEPFERQTSMQIARNLGTVGSGFLLGQAAKKISESVRLGDGPAISELLGAIVYAAMAVLLLNERRKGGEKDLTWSGPSKDVWYVEGGGHD